MPCLQTLNGIVRDCESNVGGVKNVYLINRDYVKVVTLTDGTISAITLAEGQKFKKYHQKRGQASVSSTPQFNEAGEYAGEQTVLALSFLRQDATKRLEVAALSVAELAAIYEDQNGQFFYLGYDNPVLRTGGDSGTGTANTDSNRYGIELTDTSAALPYTVTPGIVEGLVD